MKLMDWVRPMIYCIAIEFRHCFPSSNCCFRWTDGQTWHILLHEHEKFIILQKFVETIPYRSEEGRGGRGIKVYFSYSRYRKRKRLYYNAIELEQNECVIAVCSKSFLSAIAHLFYSSAFFLFNFRFVFIAPIAR